MLAVPPVTYMLAPAAAVVGETGCLHQLPGALLWYCKVNLVTHLLRGQLLDHGQCMAVNAHALLRSSPMSSMSSHCVQSPTDGSSGFTGDDQGCKDSIFTACRNARIASAVLAIAIPSVCPSVTRRYCVKTTARSTVQFALLDSKMCLVL